MSIFQRLGVAFGAGSVKISVAAAGAVQFRGYPFQGAVLLEGGSVDVPLQMLTVDLQEFWVTGSGKNRTYHTRNHGRVMLLEEFTVPTSFRQEYPFEMALPGDSRCSRRREGWHLLAEAHIRMAVDARAKGLLKVVPPPEILAVQRAARDGFGFQPLTWDGSRPEVYYNFAAPEHLRANLDGISFRLGLTADAVVGDLILNRQEHGIGGMLGAMVGADKETIPFVIPRSLLISKRGTPQPAGAHQYLADLLNSAGIPVVPHA